MPGGMQAHTGRCSVGTLQKGHKSSAQQASRRGGSQGPMVLGVKGPRNTGNSSVQSPVWSRARCPGPSGELARREAVHKAESPHTAKNAGGDADPGRGWGSGNRTGILLQEVVDAKLSFTAPSPNTKQEITPRWEGVGEERLLNRCNVHYLGDGCTRSPDFTITRRSHVTKLHSHPLNSYK